MPEPVPELERGRRRELALSRGGRGNRGGRAEQEGYVRSIQWSRQPLELVVVVVAGEVLRLRIGLKGPPAIDTHKTRGHGEVEVIVYGRTGGRRRMDADEQREKHQARPHGPQMM